MLVKGFLYSKPVPLEDFEKILTRGKCTPSKPSRNETKPKEERRKYFRLTLPDLLEADMTILSISGKKADVGETGVVVKNIGPGGLCFISNIKLPVNKEIILQFKSELSGEEIKAYGSLDWIEERDYDLFEYGLEFTFDEKARTGLTKVLNQFQVKTRKDSDYRDGRFFMKSFDQYFPLQRKKTLIKYLKTRKCKVLGDILASKI
ncbi:MAG: PilZ domain-containing protein [Alkalibacterium sp.]|nr:PilZ domain-containing protein [Alkalibacterium sp.]